MSTVNFSTAVYFQESNLSCLENSLQAFDDYFFLSGRKACVVPNTLIDGKQGVRLTDVTPKTFSDWLLVVVKIISYMTGGIPFCMLLGKAVLRGLRQFTILPPDSHKASPTIKPPKNPDLSSIEKQNKDEIPFPHATITSENFPIGATFMFTIDQTISLEVEGTGLSKRKEFVGSIFKFNPCKDYYQITRSPYVEKTISIPKIDGSGSIVIPCFSSKMETALKTMSVHSIDNLPHDILGTGCNGQVYDLPGAKTPLVFKIEKKWIEAGMADTTYLDTHPSANQTPRPNVKYIKPLSDHTMTSSFHDALAAESLIKIPQHENVMSFSGLIYVKDLNCWGVVLEKIEGKEWSVRHMMEIELKEKKSLLQSLVKGLKHLDMHGHPQTDLQASNVMIGKNGQAVIVDLDSSPISGRSIESRWRFGTMLYRSFERNGTSYITRPCKEEIKASQINKESLGKLGMPSQLFDLMIDCWSDKSMQEISWDYIHQALS